jgi:beta-lactamase regulating signal transducer with metallopeptidase domain/formylglycine-generating enzyme required for sulfatase activity
MGTVLIQITDYLLRQSWQIALLVVVIASVNFLLKNKSAHIRYLLWLIVLAKCLVPPFFAIPLAVLPPQEKAEPVSISPSTGMPPLQHQAADVTITESSDMHSDSVVIMHPPTVKYGWRSVFIREWLAISWIIGMGAFLVFNLLRALRANLWLWRRRMALSSEWQNKVAGLFAGHGVMKLPRVWLVEGFSQPFVWGLLRGSIYLPVDFLKINKPEHQRCVLSHELSHVLRFDAAVNVLQVIAQGMFWFHPLVWWANREIRAEREKCCDEMAVARLNTSPRDYSTAILEALAAKHEPARPVPSLAVAGPVKNIEERIKTMLRPGKKFHKHPSVTAAAVVLLIALLVVPTTLLLTAKADPALTPHLSGERWTNSLGMVFVPVKGTEVYFCIWETRVRDFETFIKATGRDMGNKMSCLNSEREGHNWRNPGFAQGPNHPVVGVNWDDAVAFCKWLTEKERKEGVLPKGQYRLPSDLEWSAAVGLIHERGATPEEQSEKQGVYPWGKQWPPPKGAGNYADMTARKKYKPDDLPETIEGYDDGYAETAPVGSFDPNPYGLYDMGGNVLEWCGYWWSDGAEELRPLRGASWFQGDKNAKGNVSSLLSDYRIGVPLSRASSPDNRADCIGFRVVLKAPMN